jgi:hypothetical protein
MKMTHPDASGRGKTIEVSADMAPMYASQGWQVKETTPAKPSADNK